MEQLVRDWLLDPLALLFLLSLALVAVVSWRARMRRGRGSRQSRGRLAGTIAVGVWIAVFLVTSAPAIVNPMVAFVENRYDDAPICQASAEVVVCPVPVKRIAVADVPWWALLPQTTALVTFDSLMRELLARLRDNRGTTRRSGRFRLPRWSPVCSRRPESDR